MFSYIHFKQISFANTYTKIQNYLNGYIYKNQQLQITIAYATYYN